MGNKDFGIDLETINSITEQIAHASSVGFKVSIVAGGGIYSEVFLHLQQAWIDLLQIILE